MLLDYTIVSQRSGLKLDFTNSDRGARSIRDADLGRFTFPDVCLRFNTEERGSEFEKTR
jgi:hypothetical protein